MRDMVIERIKSEWYAFREEGFQAACHEMGWSCEQDYDYESHNPILFAVKFPNVNAVYVIQQGSVNEDLDIVLSFMSDDALLHLLEAQHCLKYR